MQTANCHLKNNVTHGFKVETVDQVLCVRCSEFFMDDIVIGKDTENNVMRSLFEQFLLCFAFLKRVRS